MNKLAQLKSCPQGKCCKQTDGLNPCAGAACDVGIVRETNDDLVFASNGCRLYVALDGVGGNSGGAQASEVVLRQLHRKIKRMCFANNNDPKAALEVAIGQALRLAALEMMRLGTLDSDLKKMGTVFSLAYLVDRTLLYTSVGDARVYLLRGNKLRQLTEDETYVQRMVASGAIAKEDVRQHPMRHVILNAVNARFMTNDPVVRSAQLRDNDTILLTTDGVTDTLTPSEMENLLRQYPDPDEAAMEIVDAAIEEGSSDNSSCVVVRVCNEDSVAPKTPIPHGLRRAIATCWPSWAATKNTQSTRSTVVPSAEQQGG